MVRNRNRDAKSPAVSSFLATLRAAAISSGSFKQGCKGGSVKTKQPFLGFEDLKAAHLVFGLRSYPIKCGLGG